MEVSGGEWRWTARRRRALWWAWWGRMKTSVCGEGVGSVDREHKAKRFYMNTFIWEEHLGIYSIGSRRFYTKDHIGASCDH